MITNDESIGYFFIQKVEIEEKSKPLTQHCLLTYVSTAHIQYHRIKCHFFIYKNRFTRGAIQGDLGRCGDGVSTVVVSVGSWNLSALVCVLKCVKWYHYATHGPQC